MGVAGGESGTKEYAFQFQWWRAVNKDSVRIRRNRVIEVYVKKARSESWAFLGKAGKKLWYVHIDWDKWVDSDEEEAEGIAGGFDTAGMNTHDSDLGISLVGSGG